MRRVRDRQCCVRHAGAMPFPDRLLGDDEEVVAHLHPHVLTVVRPLVCLFATVGAGCYAAAGVPAGAQQGLQRIGIAAVALVLCAVLVVRPLSRWAATHYVLTTHRVLLRRRVLSRRARDLALSRVADVSYRQTFGQWLIRSGTVVFETVGDGGTTALERVPRGQDVVALVHRLLRGDDDRQHDWEDDRATGAQPRH